ncbi:sensor histidine kinase [uncultured Cellulomonas sp.]|uniref:sensor histidine kinase n=1 Tax=uncultured Cellulomonas sp. TaxID=189682 RepID=UPI0026261FF7|nr:histidine kinase [uncultured Cellulomonas sp.]
MGRHGGLTAWDLALAAVATTLLVAEAVAEDPGSPVPVLLAGAMGACLATRRRFPFASYLVSSAGLLLLAGFFYDAGFYPFPNALSLYAVGAHATRRRSVVGLVVGLGGVAWYWALVPSVGIPWLPGLIVAGWALAWVAGQAERGRRRAAADVVHRAREAEERREVERAAAVARERTRLAHEVHDIVGHALNVMVLQAGAARRMLDLDRAASADALATVEAVGRDALGELDGALGALDGPALRRPARGPDDLDELAARFTGAGVPVTVQVAGTPRPLPTDVGIALYRAAQEALTNVAKHAPGVGAQVDLRYDDDAVRLRVTDRAPAAAPPDPSGRGLVGIRTRMAALGGTAEAGPDPHGGWTVRCTVPMAPASS